MKIKQITRQHRRDFTAIFECEGCHHVMERTGYDDRNFHDNVIPLIKCDRCDKNRNEFGLKGSFTPTFYPEGMNV
jgi:hypothetical protein